MTPLHTQDLQDLQVQPVTVHHQVGPQIPVVEAKIREVWSRAGQIIRVSKSPF